MIACTFPFTNEEVDFQCLKIFLNVWFSSSIIAFPIANCQNLLLRKISFTADLSKKVLLTMKAHGTILSLLVKKKLGNMVRDMCDDAGYRVRRITHCVLLVPPPCWSFDCSNLLCYALYTASRVLYTSMVFCSLLWFG